MGTPEWDFVLVLCLPHNLGTFDSVFVPVWSFHRRLGTNKACFVPVLCLPHNLGTFDSVFVPVWGPRATWAQKGRGLLPFEDSGY